MVSTLAPHYCHLCGSRLVGRFFRYETGLVVCAACQRTRARCERCGVPLAAAGSVALPSGAALCLSCAQTAPRCATCAVPITGVHYTFDDMAPLLTPRTFCAQCVSSRPRCDVCRAPALDTAVRVADGQYRCPLCAVDMVTTADVASGLYVRVVEAFKRVSGASLRQLPTLQLISRRQMSELRLRFAHAESRSSDDGAMSSGYHVLGYFVREGQRATVYVETALPRPLFSGTLAHELGHAWQAAEAPDVRDPLLCEGFAEWIAYTVQRDLGDSAVAGRALRREDIYGQGLRRYLGAQSSGGVSGVLALARGQAG